MKFWTTYPTKNKAISIGILINVGYKVSQGEIIATSKKYSLDSGKELLHFEVYYKGNSIDPENLYTLLRIQGKVSDNIIVGYK